MGAHDGSRSQRDDIRPTPASHDIRHTTHNRRDDDTRHATHDTRDEPTTRLEAALFGVGDLRRHRRSDERLDGPRRGREEAHRDDGGRGEGEALAHNHERRHAERHADAARVAERAQAVAEEQHAPERDRGEHLEQ